MPKICSNTPVKVPSSQAVEFVRRHGTLHSRGLVERRVTQGQLPRMVRAGTLVRVSRGLYALPDHREGENPSVLAVARPAPKMVFCWPTALQLNELTTQAPFDVWIAIGNKAHPSRMDYPALRTMRLSAEALKQGVETRHIDGVRFRLTTVAGTVADCFNFRKKFGLDVALKALRDANSVKKGHP